MAIGKQQVASGLCALILAAIFIYAGILKILRPDLLMTDILSYDILPYRLAYFASYFMPAFEVVLGVCVLWPRFRKESALLIFLLLIAFIAALISAWVRGLDISCGCFGASEIKANYPWLITRDVLMALPCVYLIFSAKCSPRRC